MKTKLDIIWHKNTAQINNLEFWKITENKLIQFYQFNKFDGKCIKNKIVLREIHNLD